MEQSKLAELLESVARGATTPGEAADRLRTLPFEDLGPTDGFQPAKWISRPDYNLGEMLIRVSVSGVGEAPVVYSVSYHSENIDTVGHLRRIAIRVEWDRSSGARGVYTIAGVRAG